MYTLQLSLNKTKGVFKLCLNKLKMLCAAHQLTAVMK